MKSLTLKEAIEQGYSYAGEEGAEYIIKLSKIDENYREYYDLRLCELTPTYMRIDEDAITEKIAEIIDYQEEFYTEDSLSSQAFEGTDELFKLLTNKINENLSKQKFWFLTDIKLIL